MAVSPYVYIIELTDPAVVAAQNALYPNGINIPPAQAAILYGASFGVGGPANAPLVYVIPSYVGGDITPFYNTEYFTIIPYNPGSPPQQFAWLGYFMLTANGRTDSTPSQPVVPTLGQRRWINGFELPQLGDGVTSFFGTISAGCRDASRTADGMGLAYRGAFNSGMQEFLPVAMQANTSWERFYMRVRTYPTTNPDEFWWCHGNVEGGSAALMRLTATGQIQVYSKGNAGFPGTNIFTTGQVLALNKWYRIDFMFHFSNDGTGDSGKFSMYINGAAAGNGIIAPGAGGLGQVALHVDSEIGHEGLAASNGAEIDFDDWISANAQGAAGAALGTPGFDLTSGSHVQAIHFTDFGPGHSNNWVGDIRSTFSVPPDGIVGAPTLVCTVNSSLAQVISSLYAANQRGYAAVNLGCWVLGKGGDAQFIFNIDKADGTNLASVSTVVSVGTWCNLLWSIVNGTKINALDITGGTAPRVSIQTKTGGGTRTIASLTATGEALGYFGAEDTNNLSFPPFLGVHNGPYLHIGAQQQLTPPLGPVNVSWGTYVGNNLAQDVLSQYPAHWWYVRNVTAGSGGVFWWTSMQAAHAWLGKLLLGNYVSRAWLNPPSELAAKVSFAGNDVGNNAAATTYQWVAFSDPAMRYLINGAFSHKAALATAVNSLIDPLFTPDGVFFMMEDYVSGVTGHFFKGIGHTANAASPLDGVQNANIAGVAAGSITSLTAIHTSIPQTAFAAWRRSDGVYTGAVDLVTYTGDGNASRDIPVVLGGATPVLAMVTPHNGATYVRDISDVTTTSHTIAGGNSATAITAMAANKITVGITLNALGIVYDVFVLPAVTGPVPTIIRPTPGPWTFTPNPNPAPVPAGGCTGNLV